MIRSVVTFTVVISLLVLAWFLTSPTTLPAGASLVENRFDWLVRDLFGDAQSKLDYFTDHIERPELGKLETSIRDKSLNLEVSAARNVFLRAELRGPNGTQTLFDRVHFRSKKKVNDLPDGEYTVAVTPFNCVLLPLKLTESLGQEEREVCRDGYTEYATVQIDTGMPSIHATAVLDYSSGDTGAVQEVLIVTIQNDDVSGFVKMDIGSHSITVADRTTLRAEVPAPIASGEVNEGTVLVTLTDAAGNVGQYQVPIDPEIRNGWVLLGPEGKIQGLGPDSTCIRFFGCNEGYVRLHVTNGEIVETVPIDPNWFYIKTLILGAILVIAGGLGWAFRDDLLNLTNGINLGGPRIHMPS